MINFEKIKRECPKSWELLRKWVNGKIQEMKTKIMQGAPLSEEEDALFEVNDVLIESTISWQLRSLIDFAEQNKLKLTLGYSKESSYFYNILRGEELKSQNFFQNRPEMEESCFTEIFKMLE